MQPSWGIGRGRDEARDLGEQESSLRRCDPHPVRHLPLLLPLADPDPDERQRYVNSLEFELVLGDGKVYPHKGKFYALDRNLDPKTGAIRYEVTFPNTGNNLRPGQFGKVRFVADMKKGAMVVPQEAVNELQGSYQVAVVDQNNKVSIRPVKMGERIAALWEITDGLNPGDRVVVQGLQKAREGSTVTPKEWTPPSSPTPAPSVSPQKP